MRLTWNMARSSLALIGVAIAGCMSDEAPAATAIPVIALDSPPLVSIGTEDGSPAELLAGAYSALLLRDSSIVIANNGTHEIRIFDHTGQHLRTVGRVGSGPGEFRSYLVAYFDDRGAVAVYDHGGQRVTTYDDDWQPRVSNFIRSESGGDAPGPTWLYGRYWIQGVVGARERDEVRRTLDLAGLNSFHAVLRDPAGCIWTTPEGPYGSSWTVRGPDGRPILGVALPEDAQLLQVAVDRVLLRHIDSLGLGRISVHSLETPQGCAATPPSEANADGRETLEGTREPPEGLTRALMYAQEVHYSKHARYADTAASLELPASARDIVLLRGDKQGYLAIAMVGEGFCGIGVGYPTPAFWVEGVPYCS